MATGLGEPHPDASGCEERGSSTPAAGATTGAYPFPVVGVGASAGGVPALIEFFSAALPTAGIAYVVVQHLSPEHTSLMAEILSRHTEMSVREIEDGVRVQPNSVYVIRPGYTVTLDRGQLRLGESVQKRGHQHPVDDFFRSLADECRERAIAVVLSGTGTNGTAGAQAVKAVGGVCIAQDPESAEFPGMPRAMMAAGYADRVLPAGEIAPLIERFVQQPYVSLPQPGGELAPTPLPRDRRQLTEIIAILRTRTGHQFAGYKPSTLLRRIYRRMGLAGVDDVSAYAAWLREDRHEPAALANDLMINVTGFFRDPDAWEALRTAVLRPMVEAQPPGQQIRAWVAACASGEEPYTLAMLVAEEAERAHKQLDVRIFATDTADGPLALARAGLYPGGIEADMSAERLERYFQKEEHTYRIRREIRDMVVFSPQDALRDPPFSRLDICTCRNLLIYLEPEAQRQLIAKLHFALRDGGVVFLGNAETLGSAEVHFETLSKKWRIYRRVSAGASGFGEVPRLLPTLRAPSGGVPAHALPPVTTAPPAALALQSALLDELVPPTLVVDSEHRVLYFHGDTSAFLTHPAGEPTRQLFELLYPAIRAAARTALKLAKRERRAVTVEVGKGSSRSGRSMTVTASPLPGPGGGGEPPRVIRHSRPRAWRCRGQRDESPRQLGGRRCGRRARGRAAGHPWRAPGDARSLRGEQCRAQSLARGAHLTERGAAELERGAGDEQGGAAVSQRGAAHHQFTAPDQDPRARDQQQRPRQSAQQHRCCRRLSRSRTAGAPLHPGRTRPHRPHSRRHRQADFRPRPEVLGP